jgi:dolichol-phosphate mannosyltransferase
MGAGPLRLCVVVPMYDEEANAERCVRAVCAVLAALPHESRLLVVDDGSRDGTAGILARLAAEERRLTVVTHERNAGYGAALRTGIARAAADGFTYVLFMDSDLTNDPRYVPRFVEKMEAGFDVIKGSRYMPGGRVEGVPFHRVAISVVGNAIARRLYRLPLTDVTNGYRAARVDLLRRLPLGEPGFSIIMEELYWESRLTTSFAEVPVTLTNRPADARPTSFRYRPAVFWRYLKYPLRRFLGPSGTRSVRRAHRDDGS